MFTRQEDKSEVPKSQGFPKAYNDPAQNQQRFEEVKAKQSVSGTAGQWFSKIGGGLGFGPTQKESKNYTTCLTYMKYFEGKHVIMTGATGGLGAKVARKLLKAGNTIDIYSVCRRKGGIVCLRSY